jgi:hypothetical protein
VQDDTTTNRTLDADEATFPLGGKRIFAVRPRALSQTYTMPTKADVQLLPSNARGPKARVLADLSGLFS